MHRHYVASRDEHLDTRETNPKYKLFVGTKAQNPTSVTGWPSYMLLFTLRHWWLVTDCRHPIFVLLPRSTIFIIRQLQGVVWWHRISDREQNFLKDTDVGAWLGSSKVHFLEGRFLLFAKPCPPTFLEIVISRQPRKDLFTHRWIPSYGWHPFWMIS